MQLTEETKLPSLTPRQIEALRRFATFGMDIESLRAALAGIFEFDFEKGLRTADGHFRMPEPGIVITREHISTALEKKRLGQITERDLVFWATMLLMNDAYALDPGDEDMVAEWLNDISFNLDAT
jgi:hypothetical protein